MSVLNAIILAVVQGLTEFLPVSSSGHLLIFEKLLGVRTDDVVEFVVLLHLASALAVIVFARNEIRTLFTREGRPLILLIAAGTIPAAAGGVLFKDAIEGLFSGSMLYVGIGLLVTAAVLLAGDRLGGGGKADYGTFGVVRGLFVGLAQAVAMAPGISRSGSTISAGMLLGLQRELAVNYSFLLAVPIIMGAGAMKLLDAGSAAHFFRVEYAAAFVVCFLVSLGALWLLIETVRGKKLSYFSFYCLLAGIGSIIWSMAT